MLAKHLRFHANSVKKGEWKRTTGIELAGKTLGIIGLGRIGGRVADLLAPWRMRMIGFDPYVDDSIYVRDLKVDAAKVEILDEADELLVRVVPVRVEAEPTPAAAEVPAEGAEVVEGVAPAEGEAAAPAKPGAPTGAAGAAPKPAATAPAAPKPGAPAKPEAQKK